MSKPTRISRRTVLRGLGTAVALPWLEASLPRIAFGAETPKPPVRMAFLSVPNGKHMPDWTPDQAGADFELKPTLQPPAHSLWVARANVGIRLLVMHEVSILYRRILKICVLLLYSRVHGFEICLPP